MMKTTLLILLAVVLAACAGQKNTVIFTPEPVQETQKQEETPESWEIVESQNGASDARLPVWVRLYLDNNVRELETLDAYSGRYMFVGESRGENFNALQQWANNFAIEHDFPRLIVQRVEQRFFNSASLYPDDEYGEYFASMIREVSDAEYSGIAKEQSFWIKKKITIISGEDTETPQVTYSERYEFLVLVSVNRELLQRKIREIMAGIKTAVPPTREQAAAISRVNRTFFEGF